MVEDFNEFSAIVTNPVDRLRLKHFVRKNSLKSVNPTEKTAPLCYTGTGDDVVNYPCTQKFLHYCLYQK